MRTHYTNATGTKRFPPLFIGKYHEPRCFEKKTAYTLGFRYFCNKTAWMTKEIFVAWLESWDFALRQKDKRILLLLDNFSGHKIDSNKLSNIQLELFAPNLTAHVQPCDANIICSFKAYFRCATMVRTIDKLMTEGVTGNMFVIHQLNAM